VGIMVGAWLTVCAGGAAAVDTWAVIHAQDVALHLAQSDLKDSLHGVGQGLGQDSASVARAEIKAAQAGAEVRAARRRLDSDWMARALGIIPGIRGQLHGVRVLEDVVTRGADVALHGETLLASLQDARKAPGHGPAVDLAGRFYLAHEKDIEALVNESLALPPLVRSVDRRHLLPPLRAAYGQLDAPMRQVTQADPDVRAALAAAPSLLGRDHPARYLLLFADNAELRAGGGLIGTYGVLGFDHGAYQKPRIQSVYKLEDPLTTRRAYRAGGNHYFPTPTPLLQAFDGDRAQTWFLRDSAWSVQWPDDARQAEKMYLSESGQPVDGVIQLDVSAIADLLEVTGPIQAAPAGKPPQSVDSSNVTEVLLDNTRGSQAKPNKDFLGIVEQALNDRIEALPPEELPKLLKAVTRASEERHLMVYINSPSAQALITAHQLDRPIPGPSGDALMVAYTNLGGDKADQFTSRSTTVTVDGQGNHHVAVRFENRTPGGFKRPFTIFLELVQFYLPPDATDIKATGLLGRGSVRPSFAPGPLDRGAELGWHVYGGWVLVETGRDGTVFLDYRRPPVGTDFTFSMVKQAGASGWPVMVELRAPGFLPGKGGTSEQGVVRWKFDLARDTAVQARRDATVGGTGP
jgi:hypothetical protein